jgi:predicted nuclease of predicted toxin-antitoxin system
MVLPFYFSLFAPMPQCTFSVFSIRESRIIFTSDLDFSRIVALSALDKPGIILFRAGNITDDQMLKLLQNVLTQVSPAQLQASIISVEATRLRISPLPVKPT